VFERFVRADPSRARASGGSGLGLSIVDGIVRAHGGRVQAANRSGGGVTFTVTLPHEPPPAPTTEA
jgi:signal transduction histidine kinase